MHIAVAGNSVQLQVITGKENLTYVNQKKVKDCMRTKEFKV